MFKRNLSDASLIFTKALAKIVMFLFGFIFLLAVIFEDLKIILIKQKETKYSSILNSILFYIDNYLENIPHSSDLFWFDDYYFNFIYLCLGVLLDASFLTTKFVLFKHPCSP